MEPINLLSENRSICGDPSPSEDRVGIGPSRCVHAGKISGQPIINPKCISSHKMLDVPSERLLQSLICSWHSFSIAGSKETARALRYFIVGVCRQPPAPQPDCRDSHTSSSSFSGLSFPFKQGSRLVQVMGRQDNKQQWQFQEVVGTCKSLRGILCQRSHPGSRACAG